VNPGLMSRAGKLNNAYGNSASRLRSPRGRLWRTQVVTLCSGVDAAAFSLTSRPTNQTPAAPPAHILPMWRSRVTYLAGLLNLFLGSVVSLDGLC
jgi:hypothetical protein